MIFGFAFRETDFFATGACASFLFDSFSDVFIFGVFLIMAAIECKNLIRMRTGAAKQREAFYKAAAQAVVRKHAQYRAFKKYSWVARVSMF